MLPPQAVVISDQTAHLWPRPVLFDVRLRQERELGPLLRDVQNVTVDVEVVDPIRLGLLEDGEEVGCLVELAKVVVDQAAEAGDERARGEERLELIEGVVKWLGGGVNLESGVDVKEQGRKRRRKEFDCRLELGAPIEGRESVLPSGAQQPF